MPERVNNVEENYVISKNGKKFLCTLVHVADKNRRTVERNIWFSEADRDDLLGRSLDRLKRSNITPDFYLEKWPQDSSRHLNSFFVKPPIVYLKIEFYKILREI
ncbi:MAG: hypothetical protein ABIH63_00400 [archaeon]